MRTSPPPGLDQRDGVGGGIDAHDPPIGERIGIPGAGHALVGSTAPVVLAELGAGVGVLEPESTKVRVSSTASTTFSPTLVLLILAAIGLAFSMRLLPAEVMVTVRALTSTAAMRPSTEYWVVLCRLTIAWPCAKESAPANAEPARAATIREIST